MNISVFRRCGVAVFLLCAVWATALDVPPRNAQKLLVQDETGTLNSQQIEQLHSKLKSLNDTDGTQIAVLMIGTLDDDDLFDFAQRTAVQWGIGQQAEDNGLLFLIVKDDRKMRIHTGRGVEHLVPDITAQQIMNRDVRPHLREGRFLEGINAGIESLIAALRGAYKATPVASSAKSSGSAVGFWIFLILFIVVWWWFSRQARKAAMSQRGRSGRQVPGVIVLPDVWGTGGHFPSGGGGGWDGGGGGIDFGGGDFGGGGASGDW